MANYINNILKRGSFEFEGSIIRYAVNSTDRVIWFQLSDICNSIQLKNWFNPSSNEFVLKKIVGIRKTLFTPTVPTWGIKENDVMWFLDGYTEVDSVRGDRAFRLLKVIKAFVKSEQSLGVQSYGETIISDKIISAVFLQKDPANIANDNEESDLKKYFLGILRLSKSNNEFPVDLDDVWSLAYDRKDNAVRSIKKNFIEDVDYKVIITNAENIQGGRPTNNYSISIPCLEYLVARKKKEVFEVYRQVFHKTVNDDLTMKVDFSGFQIPQKFSEALLLSAQLQQTVEVQEAKILEDKPKVAYYSEMIENRDYFTTTTIATELRTSAQILNQYLRKRGVLTSNSGIWKVTDEHQILLAPSPFKSIIRWNHEGRDLIRQLWEEVEMSVTVI